MKIPPFLNTLDIYLVTGGVIKYKQSMVRTHDHGYGQSPSFIMKNYKRGEITEEVVYTCLSRFQ